MHMGVPVNFDSVGLDGLLSEWVLALREYSVEAVVVLGPDPFGGLDDRLTLAAHPPLVQNIADALAQSEDFGSTWREADASLVAWQHISKSAPLSASRWRVLSLACGFQTVTRVGFSLPAKRAFECYLFSPRLINDRAEVASLTWSVLSIWPAIKRCITEERSILSPRERECLSLAFSGSTARESAEQLGCSERTVNYHIANAMAKMKVDNKMAAIQRACWLGAV